MEKKLQSEKLKWNLDTQTFRLVSRSEPLVTTKAQREMTVKFKDPFTLTVSVSICETLKIGVQPKWNLAIAFPHANVN